MFQRMIDDFKDSTGTALRLTSLAAAVAVALFITTSFLCAAAFVFVLQRYGLVEACLTGAGIFFVVTLIAAMVTPKTPGTPLAARPAIFLSPSLETTPSSVTTCSGSGTRWTWVTT